MRMLKLLVLGLVVGMVLTVGTRVLCPRLMGEATVAEAAEESEGRSHGLGKDFGERARAWRERRKAKDVDPAQAEEEYLEFMEKNLPRSEFKELKADLETLKESNPDAYRKRIQRGYRHVRHLQRMKEKDPERFENQIEMMSLGRKCRKLGKAYREAETDKEKEKIKAKLKKIVDELFDKRLAESEIRVKELEKEISELKKRAEERKKNKEEIVNRRLEDLTGADKALKWW